MKRLILAIAVMMVIVMAGRAQADFLGLGVGTYEVTLINSSSAMLCGTSNCVGTITIFNDPVNSTADFSWLFVIDSLTFNWDENPVVQYNPSASRLSCATESSTNSTGTCDGRGGTYFYLDYAPDQDPVRFWSVGLADGGSYEGEYTVSKIPEPTSALLMALALVFFPFLRRWRGKA